MMPRPVLIAYDGSADARHAIAVAGTLLAGPAVVAHVYGSPPPTAAPMPGIDATLVVDPALAAELEEKVRERARDLVEEGAALARAAGFDPQTELILGEGVRGVWNGLVAAAEQHDARLIVIGHRHLSWLEERLLGRVDSGVVKHARLPVLVVPAPDD